MTLIELQDILGSSIEKITDESKSKYEHANALENAEYVAKLAKQMINNADVILRTDKMCNSNQRINKITGE